MIESSSHKPLKITLGSFRNFFENSRRYSQVKGTTGINDTGGTETYKIMSIIFFLHFLADFLYISMAIFFVGRGGWGVEGCVCSTRTTVHN
jgi:hypothetical protein